jgi:hypothetical protein
MHIAYATIARCDFIISWNFKHFVNPKTIVRVRYVNTVNNYQTPSILSPLDIIGELFNE